MAIFPIISSAIGIAGEVFGGGGSGNVINGVTFGDTEFQEAQGMQSRAAQRPLEVPTLAGNFFSGGGNTYSNDETGRTVSKSAANAGRKLAQALNCTPQATGQTVQTNAAFGSPGGRKPVFRCAGTTAQGVVSGTATTTGGATEIQPDGAGVAAGEQSQSALDKLLGDAKRELEGVLAGLGKTVGAGVAEGTQQTGGVSVGLSLPTIALIGGLGLLGVFVAVRALR